MYTLDIHSYASSVAGALKQLDSGIALARKSKDSVICVIVGYGSSGGTHKIRNFVIEKLDEYIENKRVKEYLLGTEIDMFNKKYQCSKMKDKLTEEDKKKANLGNIFILI